MIKELTVTILACLVFVFLYTIEQTIKKHKSDNILGKIDAGFFDGLSINRHLSYSGNSFGRKYNIQDYLANCARHFIYNYYEPAESELNIDDSYKIEKDERSIAIDIIATYQQWLLELYRLKDYHGFSEYAKSSIKMFLFCTLKDFLTSSGNTFNNNDMLITKNIDSDTKVYFLTEYGKVFYKMYYTTTLYVENHRPTKDGKVFHHKSDSLKKILDQGFI